MDGDFALINKNYLRELISELNHINYNPTREINNIQVFKITESQEMECIEPNFHYQAKKFFL